jgi:hypothetical protein
MMGGTPQPPVPDPVPAADLTALAWVLRVNDVVMLRRELQARGMTIAQFKALPAYHQNLVAFPWLREL